MTGNSFVWDQGIIDAYGGTAKWLTATTVPCTYCILGVPTTPPTLANKQTWHTYNDVKWVSAGVPYELAVVNGYALGGSAMNTAAGTISTDTIQFKAGGAGTTVFTTTGTITTTYATTQYAAASSVTTTNTLFSNHDLAGTQQATNGTLTLTWSASGVFSITSSAAA
jgi:hypothetical protein